MLGKSLAGTFESYGNIIIRNNKKYKIIRGMAGYISNFNKNRKMGNKVKSKLTPEGVKVILILKEVYKILFLKC